MPAPCFVTQLQDHFDQYERCDDQEERVVMEAMEDGYIDDAERIQIVAVFRESRTERVTIRTEISVVKDGAEMVRTLANTFAITPKVDRKLREKRADFLELVVDNDDEPRPAA